MKAYRINVRGRVQRVGFRRYILDLAQEMGLSGYVVNLPDGSVEIFVQGPSELLEEFKSKISGAPPPAKVRELVVCEEKFNPQYKHFQIKHGSLEEELQEGFGAMHSTFLVYWNEFREFRNEFREFRSEFRGFAKRTEENFKFLMERYGEISKKLTVILETLVKESKETREQLRDAINLLARILEKLTTSNK